MWMTTLLCFSNFPFPKLKHTYLLREGVNNGRKTHQLSKTTSQTFPQYLWEEIRQITKGSKIKTLEVIDSYEYACYAVSIVSVLDCTKFIEDISQMFVQISNLPSYSSRCNWG